MTWEKVFSRDSETGIAGDLTWHKPDRDNPVKEKQDVAAGTEQFETDDDDMIYPDNHLDDDERYFLFPGQNTD